MATQSPSRYASAVLIVLSSAACATATQLPPLAPENVIVMISDGAGVEHWGLAKLARDDLAIESFPVGAHVDTRGSDHEVTGSAPGATALSTGVRSFMSSIAVGPDSLPRETVLERAAARGMATGLITTTAIVDATPAAFAAHVPNRGQYVTIMQQMTALPVNVLLGGGSSIFAAAEERAGVDLRTPVMERYTYVESADQLAAIDDTVTMLLGLFAPSDMPRAGEREPGLTTMLSAALDILERDPDGFFLMVENEGSDTEAHRNAERNILVAEMLDFDDAVRIALEFHERNPATLVVVTADHETGGISLTQDDARNAVLQYATNNHTAAFVPLFAIGPGSERFGGLRDNDEIGRLLLEAVRR